MCVNINKPFVHSPFSLAGCETLVFSTRQGLMERVVLERRLYDVPDYPPLPSPPPPLHLPKFTPSPPHIPLAALQPGG